ncbi:MAG: hypothetical protein LUH00_06580 [Lachnospiraceae bacterium]|nr:hypothetical protein [Lachnospiraceae bacterium]
MDGSTYLIRFEYWKRIVIACNNRTPGMKKSEWLEQNGINRHSFYNWQAKIQKAAAEEISIKQHSSDHGDCFDITDSLSQPSAVALQADRSVSVDHDSDNQSVFASASCKSPSSVFTPELMIQVGKCQIYVGDTVRGQTLKTVLGVLANA